MAQGWRWVWLGLVAACGVLGVGAAAQTKAGGSVTVDLQKLGLPKETFRADYLMSCGNDLLTYRAVDWVDAGRVLVAFTASPLCPTTLAPAVTAVLKVMTLDAEGKVLHAVNVSYVAGLNTALPHDGVWMMADGRVLVEFPPVPMVTGPWARGEVRVLSAELEPLQELDLRAGTPGELHLAGLTADGQRAVFWRGTNHYNNAECVEFAGGPLVEKGTCAAAELDAVEARAHDAGGFPAAKGEQAESFPGAARDGSRASTFLTKTETPECRTQGIDCPTSGTFVVFDTRSKQVLLKTKVSVLGRMALAPDGKHGAVLDKGRLEIVAVP